MDLKTDPSFQGLVGGEVRAGRCVAFIGAGFSAPTVPLWRDLLVKIAADLRGVESVPSLEEKLGRTPSAAQLEACAQQLRKDARFHEVLRAHAAKDPSEHHDTNRERRRLVAEIPFAAVLTTNFDNVLDGTVPKAPEYRKLLRSESADWRNERYWNDKGVGALKLHGAIEEKDPIIARKDYRERLYSSPAYLTFLRSIFATRTVLYLGFSFTDAYLNELRSEVLALLGHNEGDHPIAYAFVPDVDDDTVRYYRHSEGIALLRYESGKDHGVFDEMLRTLHAETNPRQRLGSLLIKKRIVWVDPSPSNNERGRELLLAAAGKSCTITQVRTVDDALAEMKDGSPDLVLTNFGYSEGAQSRVEQLVRRMRAEDRFAPVIVFAGPDSPADNRAISLRLGAFAHETQWSGLFGAIERLFGA